jgi:CheY-like chemotaxis protein
MEPETSSKGVKGVYTEVINHQLHVAHELAENEHYLFEHDCPNLKRQGYTVLGAATAGKALRLAREHAGDIDLLMTDVIMPEMHGLELAKKLLALYPGINQKPVHFWLHGRCDRRTWRA